MSVPIVQTARVIVNREEDVRAFLTELDKKMQTTCLEDAKTIVNAGADTRVELMPSYSSMSNYERKEAKGAARSQAHDAMYKDKAARMGQMIYSRDFGMVTVGDDDAAGAPVQMRYRKITLYGPNTGVYSDAAAMLRAVQTALSDFQQTLPPRVNLLTKRIYIETSDQREGLRYHVAPLARDQELVRGHDTRTSRVTIEFADYMSQSVLPQDIEAG